VQLAKYGPATPKNCGVDIEPEFINQAEPHESRSYLRTTDAHVIAGLLFQLIDLAGDVPLISLEFHPTSSRLFEKTILGIFFQIRAYSISYFGANGF